MSAFLLADGQLEAAREADRRALEIAPDNGLALKDLVKIDLLEGNATRALETVGKLRPDNDRLMYVAIVQHELGHAPESAQALAALEGKAEGDAAYRISAVHAFRGELDDAFAWLERAYAQHDLQLRQMKSDPLLRNLRGDPRYKALLAKMNLPLE
jgi:tetratricopeptide (TPR) repeat protein